MDKRAGMSWVKWILIIVLLGGAAWGGWWWYSKRSRTNPTEYRTAVVTRGDVIQAVTATGQLNPVANVQVGSQISGMIHQLYADFNSSVTQGQVIAEIEASTFRAAVHQTEGELANARAVLELMQVEARRAGELRTNKLISESEYDRAIAQLHQAEAQVMIRQANLERARVDLSRCTILSPTNGIVISRNVDVGQTVAASLSAPTLFVIANDLSKMQIDAMVSEADIGGVEVGQQVNFTVDAFPTRTFDGTVVQIRNSPATNQNVVTYDTVVTVENRDLKLKPGMTANVSIIIAEREDVLKVPNAAFRFRPPELVEARPVVAARPGDAGPAVRAGAGPGGDRRGPGGGGGRGARSRGESAIPRIVHTITSTNNVAGQPAEKPVARQVQIGISDGMFTEVTAGVNEGDIVVTGINSSDAAAGQRPSNPFAGGGRRF